MASADITAIEVSGLSVWVRRTAVKTLRLRVRPDGELWVSAPPSIGDEQIRGFVQRNIDWVDVQRRRVIAAQGFNDCPRAGGRLLFWGDWLDVQQMPGRRASAKLVGATVQVQAADDETARRAIGRLRKRELASAVQRLSPRWEAELGCCATGYRYRAMVSRWGSCNTTTRRITLNTWLTQRAPEQLEYVLVHELTHLLESGHGPRFHAVVSAALPNWREVRAKLQSQPPLRG